MISSKIKGTMLVEVLVVMTIITTLIVIGIINYKNHAIKNKFHEVISSIKPYQTKISSILSHTGKLPENKIEYVNSSHIVKIEFSKFAGDEYINVYPQNFYPNWKKSQVLRFHGKVDDNKITWDCCQLNSRKAVPNNYIPRSCRNICS